jgi:hypothetical protein
MSDSDLSVFDHPIEEKGIKYYVFPAGYPLFKAKQTSAKATKFTNNFPSFFGIKNMSHEYIEAYEEEYGIIFEYITTRKYKLLALDDKSTQTHLYTRAPSNIQKILEDNYGYTNNIRNSVGEKDKEFANYLCSLGYDGYATNVMSTDFGGKFHIELLICNAKDGIEYVQRITHDSKIDYILETGQSKRHANELKESRKKKPRHDVESSDMEITGSPPRRNMFGSPPRRNIFESPPRGNMFESPPRGNMFGNDFSTPPSTPPRVSGSLFGSDSPPSTPKGGKKINKKTYKKNKKGKRKTNRQHKK